MDDDDEDSSDESSDTESSSKSSDSESSCTTSSNVAVDGEMFHDRVQGRVLQFHRAYQHLFALDGHNCIASDICSSVSALVLHLMDKSLASVVSTNLSTLVLQFIDTQS